MKKTSARKTKPPVHPSHEHDLPRLRRIKGQVEGLERMIGQGRYCVDILNQIKAARSALQALEGSVLQRHLETCLREALDARRPFDAQRKIKEITDLLGK